MRASGSQMSGNGYGSRDSVQAPLTLITAFGRLASSSTFGRSAQGCGGAGDVSGPVRHAVPRPLRRIGLIGMHLGIDDRHRASSSVSGEFGCRGRPMSRGCGARLATKFLAGCLEQYRNLVALLEARIAVSL